MNIPKFIMEARAHDECDPDKTTSRKLALRYAGIVDDLTTTAIGRGITTDNAKEALRTLVMLGIRLGFEDAQLISSLTHDHTMEIPLVNAGYCSTRAALGSIDDVEPYRRWDYAVDSFKAVLKWRHIEFDSSLSHFLLPE